MTSHAPETFGTMLTSVIEQQRETWPALPVIFRKGRTKDTAHEITAVFPTLPSDCRDWYDMVCYAHIGQHGGCSVEWYSGTRAATWPEYAPLLRELCGIYEDPKNDPVRLVVYKRLQRAHVKARQEEYYRIRKVTA